MQKWAVLFTFKYHTCNTFPLKRIWSPKTVKSPLLKHSQFLFPPWISVTHACTHPWLKILSLMNTSYFQTANVPLKPSSFSGVPFSH